MGAVGAEEHRIVVVALLDAEAGVIGEECAQVWVGVGHARTIARRDGRAVNGE